MGTKKLKFDHSLFSCFFLNDLKVIKTVSRKVMVVVPVEKRRLKH